MQAEKILSQLNDEQRSAVTAPPGHWLILAGAGCGKTRVLVHRVAWQILNGVAPRALLAVTFTNKAAGEMRGRILQLAEVPVGPMWVGTFHGIAHRILRFHAQAAGLVGDFQIIDSQDQLGVLRQLLKANALPPAELRQLQGFINACKDRARRPASLEPVTDASAAWIDSYRRYQEHCDREGLVDFAELLLRVYELFRRDAEVQAVYHQRFQCILVDEFQDTNALQYNWIRLLCGDGAEVFAVGDDDQSIYGWRGARVDNLQHFTRDFKDCRLLRLERNYRSTGNILAVANGLIACNGSRIGKELWTSGEAGDPVRVFAARDEQDEARHVSNDIIQWRDTGGVLAEVAVLYRVSALSRTMEEACLHAELPYRVRGGLRFYDRKEIKDAMAYLRLAVSADDDMAFRRVVNFPPRGIGPRTLRLIEELAEAETCSLRAAARRIAAPARVRIEKFLELLDELAAACHEVPLREAMTAVIRGSGMDAHYQQDKDPRSISRRENLDELVNACSWYDQNHAEEGTAPILSFLAHTALESGDESGDEQGVQLMTVHAAKGLEFDRVYILGLEEGLFPHSLSQGDPAQLEEERRLCYVGMTRARRALTLCWSSYRMLHGEPRYHDASRFLGELPAHLLEHLRPEESPSQDFDFRLGQQVVHGRYGQGTILKLEGRGRDVRLMVNFEHTGCKWLLAHQSRLWPVDGTAEE